jgi:hypothetical protein
VVNLSDTYRNEREVFRKKYSQSIYDELYTTEPALKKFFNLDNP